MKKLGGYIVHKLHNNFRNHKNWRELQQATSLIGVCRKTKPCENQELNSVMSRGGLSFIKPQFQKILVIAERYFRRKIEVFYLSETDVKNITYDLINFKYINEYFAEIAEESVLEPMVL